MKHLQSRRKNGKFNKISFMAVPENKKDKSKKMILVKNMPDLRNDPFLQKKKEEAIAFLKKNGHPFAEKKK
jgi:hypothetical protein